MILELFIFIWVALFVIFTSLAFSLKSMKVYLTGAITALFYFLAASEGVVYVFHNKIPVVGFMVNPFPGTYSLLRLNLQYNWTYFVIALIISLIVMIHLRNKIRKTPK